MMLVDEMVKRFSKEAPIALLGRATLTRALEPKALDRLFAETAVQQKMGDTLFSTVVDLLGLAVMRVRNSVNAGYQAKQEEISVSIKSIYNKTAGVEPHVAAALVRRTAPAMAETVDRLGARLPSPIPGYPVRILDGNHFRATERRLEPLRSIAAAPLPGQALAILDPELRMFVEVLPCEDAHASEREILTDLVDRLEPGAVYLGDRHFSIGWFFFELANAGCHFLIRQHASNPAWEPAGSPRKVRKTRSGVVYEQPVDILDDYGNRLRVRRITLKLHTPTEDGDTEIHLLSNLPRSVSAITLCNAYRDRWGIEGAFGELAMSLEAEIKTLAFPKAALLGFSLGLVMYNALSVVRAALRAAHGTERVEKGVSTWYLADEISGTMRGLEIAIPAKEWNAWIRAMSDRQFAAWLVRIAGQAKLFRYKKHPRGPKKAPPPRKYNKNEPHVSTHRVLQMAAEI